MSLTGTLNVGKTALTTSQAALQVTGNNIANVGNADYTRQVARTSAAPDRMYAPGIFIGTGLNLDGVVRQIDEALESRMRASVSDRESGAVLQQWLQRVETAFDPLGEHNLSAKLGEFFNAWSNLANKPQDNGLRQIVIQSGEALASWLKTTRSDLENMRTDAATQLRSAVGEANDLATKIAELNGKIVVAEGGSGGQANGLRDQRDALLRQLSSLIDIRTVDAGGQFNVYVGSEPLIMGADNRGLALKQESVDGELITSVTFARDGGTAKLTSGRLGALLQFSGQQIDEVIAGLDEFANGLIFELNKIHSSGQGLQGFSTVTGTTEVADPTAALNAEAAGIPFVPGHGSFVVHVIDTQTGQRSSTLINVDLDGLNGNDTTLQSLAASLSAVDNLTASVAGGRLKISADSANLRFSFSQDSSGVLAALGVNTFFAGSDARDIQVAAAVKADPSRLAASMNGEPTDNQTALALAQLETMGLPGLNGSTFVERYQSLVNKIAVASFSAASQSSAAATVHETLAAQRQQLSGVSLDEEAVNLIRQQRAFQGAARVIQAVDELMRTLLQMV